jgi:hypothetical protein
MHESKTMKPALHTLMHGSSILPLQENSSKNPHQSFAR